MDFGVLLFVCRQRGECDLLQGLSELNKDQLSSLIGVAYLDSARHDGLHNIDAMPNSGHAVAVDLHVRRHSLWASAHHITPYAFCSPVAQRGWLTIRTLVAFFGMTQGGYKGENPDARSATRLQ